MEAIKKLLAKYASTAIAVIVVVADFYLAYTFPPNLILNLFQDKVGAEEIKNLEHDYGQLAGLPAGEGVPLLENIEQFNDISKREYVTFETDSIIPLPLYHLKSTQDMIVKSRRGTTSRQRPTFTQSSFFVENVYNRYYLVKLPDGNYVISFLDDAYYIQYRLQGKVQLPLGRADFMTYNEKEYLASYIEEYGMRDNLLLDMFAEERYEENDFLNLVVLIGVFFAVLAVYVVIAAIVSSVWEKMRKSPTQLPGGC